MKVFWAGRCSGGGDISVMDLVKLGQLHEAEDLTGRHTVLHAWLWATPCLAVHIFSGIEQGEDQGKTW